MNGNGGELPILAIFATSDHLPSNVVRLPNANHYVFNSNEANVLREMNAFIATLPK